MKIPKGELKPNILYLIDISAIVLLNDELAQIQSAVGGLKSIIFIRRKV